MPVSIGTFQSEQKIILFSVSMSHHGSKIHEKHFDRHSNFIPCMYLHVIGSLFGIILCFPFDALDGFIFNISKAYFSFSNHFHIQTSIRQHNILFTLQTDNLN